MVFLLRQMALVWIAPADALPSAPSFALDWRLKRAWNSLAFYLVGRRRKVTSSLVTLANEIFWTHKERQKLFVLGAFELRPKRSFGPELLWVELPAYWWSIHALKRWWENPVGKRLFIRWRQYVTHFKKLEHQSFKYSIFRQPGGSCMCICFVAAATSGLSPNGIQAQEGPMFFEIFLSTVCLPLRNTLARADELEYRGRRVMNKQECRLSRLKDRSVFICLAVRRYWCGHRFWKRNAKARFGENQRFVDLDEKKPVRPLRQTVWPKTVCEVALWVCESWHSRLSKQIRAAAEAFGYFCGFDEITPRMNDASFFWNRWQIERFVNWLGVNIKHAMFAAQAVAPIDAKKLGGGSIMQFGFLGWMMATAGYPT